VAHHNRRSTPGPPRTPQRTAKQILCSVAAVLEDESTVDGAVCVRCISGAELAALEAGPHAPDVAFLRSDDLV
jgi:hypothetical protein